MQPVEKGIPLPKDRRGGSNRKYPFSQMQLGDSILIASRASAYYYQVRNPNFHFVARREGKCYRIWRVSATQGGRSKFRKRKAEK